MKNTAERKYIVLDEETPFAIKEAYKTARTNLLFSLNTIKKEGAKIVLVSSSIISEGKTVSCLNLAASFAEVGHKVLLIDADMRRPRVHRIFGLKPAPGLSDLLGDFTQNKCLRKTSINNLLVMPSGTIPPNPAELLLSDNFKELIARGFGAFDYVFIDSPPIGIVTDAAIIAPLVDGVLLVSRQGYTEKGALEETIKAFQQVNARIIGHFFNDVDYEKYSYKYKYNSYNYHYKYKYSHDTDIKETPKQ